jgi:hypothetical protein
MQKQIIKDLLLTSIINSDFLILDEPSNKNLRPIKSRVHYKTLNLVSLDLFEVVKSLKQLIRSLTFLSKSEQRFLHVWVENKQYIRILNLFFDNNLSNLRVFVKGALTQTQCQKTVNQLLLLLTTPLKSDMQLLKRVFQKDIFLVTKINAKLEKKNWGTYKLYNDLQNFKKFIFLIVILDLIFNTKN